MNVINTNIGALKASNAANAASKALGTAMERLSTGKRINSAKDDAAGLAIATSMTAQVKGMNQAVRNANDGISLAQTAEGALSEVTNMVQRVRELAVQSASETYGASDRANMQKEVDQLATQISDVMNNTKFNGVAVFDTGTANAGAAKTVNIQASADSGSQIALTVDALNVASMHDGTAVVASVATTAGAATTITNADTLLGAISGARATLGAGQSRLESAVNGLTSNITNLSDARSRIEDTDYSGETTQLAKSQILAQASSAMLAQANQSQQNVLSLLR